MFGCWFLWQAAPRVGFGHAVGPEVTVEVVGLPPPSCRTRGAVPARPLPPCADTERLSGSCCCKLDCPFAVLSCLVVLALTWLPKSKDAKNL